MYGQTSATCFMPRRNIIIIIIIIRVRMLMNFAFVLS